MRRFFSFLFFFSFSVIVLAQRISDEQVIQYIQEASQQGRSQVEIGSELMRRGATREQLERLKNQNTGTNSSKAESQIAVEQQRLRNSVDSESVSDLAIPLTTIAVEQQESPSASSSQEQGGKKIFGMDFFSNRYLSFEPNSNIPTPVNYRLGAGDEVIIDIWGASENTIRQVISPDGSINVKGIGPMYLSGKTIREAENYLQRELTKIYEGLSENSSQITFTLGQNRSIQISVMGEVKTPGTYTLSSFSSVFHALYYAGGINSIGSLRDIQVVRNGKVVGNIDIYEYLMEGKNSSDIRLMEDDIILVSPYKTLVNITGNVKRPMYYEMKNGETISSLLKYAGGFTGDAYTQNIRLIRLNSGREKQIYNIDEMDYSRFVLTDADALVVEAVLDRFENMVEVIGAVYRSGMYQLTGGVNTVKSLIQKAEGLRGDAFLDRAQLQRQREDLTLEMIPVDLRGILNGTTADISLIKNDILYIPSIHDLMEERMLVIHGEVANPGTYLFAENMSVNDLVIKAGGLLESASTARVDVSRRIKKPESSVPGNAVGESFSFELKDGFLIGANSDKFKLEPFDEVYIRKSPVYHKQQNVTVSGEVLYSGNYALSKKNERISDLVKRAGGLTEDAYVRGARLIRRMTPEETRRKNDALKMAQTASDSISMQTLDLDATYPVGIDLKLALSKPGSDSDLVLREGDQLIIPEYINTVKINGAVMYPNTVVYNDGKNLKYYIEQAGGYAHLAKKRKAYVVYLNGTVARLKSSNSNAIEPGCEIIIPSKEAKQRMTTGEILSIGTSIASLGMMVATLVNIINRK